MCWGGVFVQTVGNPGVQAFTGLAGGNIGPAMKIRGQAKHESAGEWLVRCLAKLLTEGKVVFHRIRKRLRVTS